MDTEFDELESVSHETSVSLGVLVLRSQDRQIKPGKTRTRFQPVEKILSSIDLRSLSALAA